MQRDFSRRRPARATWRQAAAHGTQHVAHRPCGGHALTYCCNGPPWHRPPECFVSPEWPHFSATNLTNPNYVNDQPNYFSADGKKLEPTEDNATTGLARRPPASQHQAAALLREATLPPVVRRPRVCVASFSDTNECAVFRATPRELRTPGR